jgi:hypothetical protein
MQHGGNHVSPVCPLLFRSAFATRAWPPAGRSPAPADGAFAHRGRKCERLRSDAAVRLRGGVAERSNAAVSKTVSGGFVRRGFKSLPLRFSSRIPRRTAGFGRSCATTAVAHLSRTGTSTSPSPSPAATICRGESRLGLETETPRNTTGASNPTATAGAALFPLGHRPLRQAAAPRRPRSGSSPLQLHAVSGDARERDDPRRAVAAAR